MFGYFGGREEASSSEEGGVVWVAAGFLLLGKNQRENRELGKGGRRQEELEG